MPYRAAISENGASRCRQQAPGPARPRRRERGAGPATTSSCPGGAAVFSFLYLKKIKISKIYVGFGKFQKYTPVALWGATGLKCNFFSSNLQRSPWRKKKGPVAPPNGRQAPVAHPRGDQQPTGARGAGRPSCGRQGGLSPPPTGDRVRPPI